MFNRFRPKTAVLPKHRVNIRRGLFRAISRKLVIFLVILMVAIIGFWSVNKLLIVKKIDFQISDLFCNNQSEIQSAFGSFKSSWIWLDNQKSAQELTRKFRCLKSVKISKQFPDRLVVNVLGRVPVAILNRESTPSNMLQMNDLESSASSQAALINSGQPKEELESKLVDTDGVLFYPPSGQGLPIFWLNDLSVFQTNFFDPQLLSNALLVEKKLIEFGVVIDFNRLLIDSLLVRDMKNVNYLFNLQGNMPTQLASLQLILQRAKIESKEVQRIDLRFNKPVVVYNKSRGN